MLGIRGAKEGECGGGGGRGSRCSKGDMLDIQGSAVLRLRF
jgi:hypothetical protein